MTLRSDPPPPVVDPKRTSLWVARHAPTDASGLCVGRFPVPVLVPPDDAAAQARATCPAAQRLVCLWSSPAPRCLEVAQVLARGLDVELRTDERLWEISYGRWEGRRWSDLERDEGERLQLWMKNWRFDAAPGGENVATLEARVAAWWNDLQPAQTHGLVGHAGVIRALHVITGGQTWEHAMAASVDHLRWYHFGADV